MNYVILFPGCCITDKDFTYHFSHIGCCWRHRAPQDVVCTYDGCFVTVSKRNDCLARHSTCEGETKNHQAPYCCGIQDLHCCSFVCKHLTVAILKMRFTHELGDMKFVCSLYSFSSMYIVCVASFLVTYPVLAHACYWSNISSSKNRYLHYTIISCFIIRMITHSINIDYYLKHKAKLETIIY